MVPWRRGVCKWGMQSESKATHEFSWFSCNICTHWFSLTCFHWSIALFRLSLFMSRKGQCYSSPYSSEDGGRGGDYSAKTVLICIFTIIHEPQTLRSCDLYLHKESGPGKRSPCPGCVVCPSAVSSDSRHASSGNLCTSCVDPWSVSTSKLSCCLSLPHSFVLISLSVFSHFTECTLHCHRCHLGAGSQCFVSAFSVLSLPPACILCWTEFTASVGGTYRGAIPWIIWNDITKERSEVPCCFESHEACGFKNFNINI